MAMGGNMSMNAHVRKGSAREWEITTLEYQERGKRVEGRGTARGEFFTQITVNVPQITIKLRECCDFLFF